MLTFGEIQAAVAELSWAPGWHLMATRDRNDRTELLIFGTPRNAYRPDETVNGWIAPPIPPLATIADLHEWVAQQVIRVATHEALEWLQGSDGKPLFDPH